MTASTPRFASSTTTPLGLGWPSRSFAASRARLMAWPCGWSTWARRPCPVSPPSRSSTSSCLWMLSSRASATSSRWRGWATCSSRRPSRRTTYLSPSHRSGRAPITCTSVRPEQRVPPRCGSRLPAQPPRRGCALCGAQARGRRAPSAGPPHLHRRQARLRHGARAARGDLGSRSGLTAGQQRNLRRKTAPNPRCRAGSRRNWDGRHHESSRPRPLHRACSSGWPPPLGAAPPRLPCRDANETLCGDGGPAIAARLLRPAGVATTAAVACSSPTRATTRSGAWWRPGSSARRQGSARRGYSGDGGPAHRGPAEGPRPTSRPRPVARC